jgi:hypothetical protein
LIPINDDWDSAFPNRRARNRCSDALRATRDEHDVFVQPQIHALLPNQAGEIEFIGHED